MWTIKCPQHILTGWGCQCRAAAAPLERRALLAATAPGGGRSSPLSGGINLALWGWLTDAVKSSLLVRFHFVLEIVEGVHTFLKF